MAFVAGVFTAAIALRHAVLSGVAPGDPRAVVPAHGDVVTTTAIGWRHDYRCEKARTPFLLGTLLI